MRKNSRLWYELVIELIRMKILLVVLLSCFICTFSVAASYFSLSSGDLRQEEDIYNSSMNKEPHEIKGTSFGFEVGHFLTNSLAAEIGFNSVKFEKIEQEVSSPIPFSYLTDGELSVINFGFRWFLYDFISVTYGGTKTEYNPKIKASGNLVLENEIIRKTGTYYGGGVAYNFKSLQIYYDHTIYPSEDGKNPILKVAGVRLFF